MHLYVIEGRAADGKVVARAEYDKLSRVNAFLPWIESLKLVQTVRVFRDDVEQEDLKWERA